MKNKWLCMLPILVPVFLGCTSSHTDQIVVEAQQATGDRGFTPGETRSLTVFVYGGGSRTAASFYEGPVTVTFSPPQGIRVVPNPVVIDMKRANSYDRSKSSGEAAVTVDKEMTTGECSLPLSAMTEKLTSAEFTFRFTILKAKR